MSEEHRRALLVDASVFISLTEIGRSGLLEALEGQCVIPAAVLDEIGDDPAARRASEATHRWLDDADIQERSGAGTVYDNAVEDARSHLGVETRERDPTGDVALLAHALSMERMDEAVAVVVVSDDKQLRNTCKTLSTPVSGSIGLLVRSVETGHLRAEDATAELEALDEVGARLSVSLLRRAERLIDEAAGEVDDDAA